MNQIPEGYRSGDSEGQSGYTVKNASLDVVRTVMGSSERSQWVWVRLPNGDLVLGVFPQGDLYERFEKEYP